MAPRLVTAIAAERRRRPITCAFVLLLACATPLMAAWAEADEAYSATVKVDATADSAAAAREAARVDGQRRALAAVIERLSGSSDAKPPKLDDKTITDMVESFEVANERMSAVRYIADYTFHFRPSKVRRWVRVADTAPADSAGKSPTDSGGKSTPDNGPKISAEVAGNKPAVILPVYRDGPSLALWDDPNPWRAAWSERPAGPASGQLILPLGDAGDLAAIDADKAGSGKADALASIARHNGAAEAVVALAATRRRDGSLAGLDLTVKRYRSGRLIGTRASSYDAHPGEGESDLMRRAADAVASEIESVAATSDQPASLTVTVPIGSLGDWLQIRERLASVSAIRKVDLLSLSRQEAKIEVKYVGGQDQLKSSLAGVALDLDGGDPVWRIRASGAR